MINNIGNENWNCIIEDGKSVYGTAYTSFGNNGYITKSIDNGKTWSDPEQIILNRDLFKAIRVDDIVVVLAVATGGGQSTQFIYRELSGSWVKSTTAGIRLDLLSYGNGKFVSVSSTNSNVYISDDGKSWYTYSNSYIDSNRYSPTDICYGNGKFVVSFKNKERIYYSENGGSSWKLSHEVSDTYSSLKSIAYGNGKFLACGYDSSYYSTDAITWNPILLPNNGSIAKLKYFSGYGFILLTSGNKSFYTSTDGLNWSEELSIQENITIYDYIKI